MDAYLVASLSASRGTSRVLMEYLLDYYQGGQHFRLSNVRLNNVKVKMGLKDMAFISGLNGVSPVFGQTSSNDEQVF